MIIKATFAYCIETAVDLLIGLIQALAWVLAVECAFVILILLIWGLYSLLGMIKRR